ALTTHPPTSPRLASTAASCRVPADAAHPATTTAVSRLNRTDLILHIVSLLQCGRPNPARPLLPSRRSSCLLTIKADVRDQRAKRAASKIRFKPIVRSLAD